MLKNFFRGKVVPLRLILGCFLFVFVFTVTFTLLSNHQESVKRQEREARVRANLLNWDAEVKAEVQRRALEKETADVDHSVAPIADNEAPPQEPTFETVENVEVLTSGPLKGMTKAAAAEYARQHLADAKAAATKYHEWQQHRKVLDQRLIAAAEKLGALVDIRLKNVDDELQAMLDVYALMSPEQLKYARQEALKSLPVEDVDAFFDDVANYASIKTPEQIAQNAKDILTSRDSYRIARREIDIEFEQIRQALDEHIRNEPRLP